VLNDDILMRQIRKLVDGLLRYAALLKEGAYTVVLEETDDLLGKMLGLRTSLAERMTYETLQMALSSSSTPSLERTLLCGALLAVRADAHRAAGAVHMQAHLVDIVRQLHAEGEALLQQTLARLDPELPSTQQLKAESETMLARMLDATAH